MTSLIDVIFLLLIFFMLSSTFSKYGEIDLVTAIGSTAQTTAQNPPIFIKRSAESITLNGREMSLIDASEEIKRLHENGSEVVLLSISTDLSSQSLLETMVAFTKAAPIKMTIVK